MIFEMIAKKAVVWAAKKVVSAGVDAYKEFKKTAEEKMADRIDPCQPCTQSKEQRRRARQNAIDQARGRVKELPPDQQAELAKAVDRFETNNQAVEYAKLSAHAYDQYDPDLKGRAASGPPEGWEVVDPKAVGLSDSDVAPPPPATFRAVVYRNNFGMTPEYTVAFRGTEPKEGQNDINIDVQNAAGKETTSYTAAKNLAHKLNRAQEGGKIGSFAVTGHSLGGGLAQTAATKMGRPTPPGFMFNSAGAHPRVAGTDPDAIPGENFNQFRSPCDPLTAISGTREDKNLAKHLQRAARGVQAAAALPSKAAAAAKAAGAKVVGWFSGAEHTSVEPEDQQPADRKQDVSGVEIMRQVVQADGGIASNMDKYGWYVPPNAGKMHGVSSYGNDGKEIDCTDAGGQHSITNLVNGMEHDKTVDLLVMGKYGCATVGALSK